MDDKNLNMLLQMVKDRDETIKSLNQSLIQSSYSTAEYKRNYEDYKGQTVTLQKYIENLQNM